MVKPERILVTGGSGSVGRHLTEALVAAGHNVRLLGPGPERPGQIEYRRGEVGDVAAVGRAVKDCTAVINAAPGLAGSTTVLKAAVAEGCDPIVQIQADAEVIAQKLQEAGSPVAIVHTGDVFGPDDPEPGELTVLIRDILHGWPIVQPEASWFASDVRDVARLAVTALDAGEPTTYPAPARTLDSRGLWQILREVTGRRLPAIALPWRREKMPAAAGESARPTAETVRDTVVWLHRTGHLTAKQAGKAT